MIDLVLFSGAKPSKGYQEVLPVHIHRISATNALNKIKHHEHRLVIVEGSPFNRKVVDNKFVDILFHPEKNQRKDSFHFRSSGIDEVICKIAKKNKISIGFSFSEILNNKDQPTFFGRVMAAVKICRKYKVPILFASFALNEHEQRQTPDLLALLVTLGMTKSEAKKALEQPMTILKEKDSRKSYISEGIKKA